MRMRTWMLTEDGCDSSSLCFRFGFGGVAKLLLLPLPPVTGDLSDCSQSRAQLCGTDWMTEAWWLFSFQNFVKFFKIFRHIEFLDACMKHEA